MRKYSTLDVLKTNRGVIGTLQSCKQILKKACNWLKCSLKQAEIGYKKHPKICENPEESQSCWQVGIFKTVNLSDFKIF